MFNLAKLTRKTPWFCLPRYLCDHHLWVTTVPSALDGFQWDQDLIICSLQKSKKFQTSEVWLFFSSYCWCEIISSVCIWLVQPATGVTQPAFCSCRCGPGWRDPCFQLTLEAQGMGRSLSPHPSALSAFMPEAYLGETTAKCGWGELFW